MFVRLLTTRRNIVIIIDLDFGALITTIGEKKLLYVMNMQLLKFENNIVGNLWSISEALCAGFCVIFCGKFPTRYMVK
jgi:hypothetical protein